MIFIVFDYGQTDGQDCHKKFHAFQWRHSVETI